MHRSLNHWKRVIFPKFVKWLVVLILFLSVYSLYIRLTSVEFDEKQFWKNVQIRNFPTENYKLLAKYCDGDCLYVMEKLVEDVGRFRVYRLVTFRDDDVNSFVCSHHLKPDFNEEDTSKWPEDHSQLAEGSINNGQIVQIFRSGQLPLSTDIKKNVLIFGAGTGTAFMHLQHHFKKMTITGLDIDEKIVQISREWFDFKPDPPNRFLLQNVEDHVKISIEENYLYDIVLADVCQQKISNNDWTCPPVSLITDEFISNLRKSMKPNGILSVNMLHFKSYEKYEQLLPKFEKFFESCEIFTVKYAMNALLTCYTSQQPEKVKNQDLMSFLIHIGIEF